jgi:hypothetical protein
MIVPPRVEGTRILVSKEPRILEAVVHTAAAGRIVAADHTAAAAWVALAPA